VPAPSYTETITRYLREDGIWEVPTNTTYTFASGTTGDFTVTPSGGTAQTVSIGKPATAGDADTVDGYSLSMFGHFKDTKTVFDTTNSTWYIKVDLNLGWNSDSHHLFFRPNYNNIAGNVELELPSYDDAQGYIIKTSSYNRCNISGIRYIHDDQNTSVYLRLNGGTGAFCSIYSTCDIISASVVSKPSINFIDVKSPAIQTNYSIYAPKLHGTAEKADKLSTPRKIWGQDFDGSGDVSGDMNGVGVINKVFKVTSTQDIAQLNVSEESTTVNYSHLYVSSNNTSHSNSRPLVLQNGYGNVGIGVIAPTQKLEVNGNVKATSFIGNLDGTYVNKLTGYAKASS
jgi:hypothetical protein